MAGVKVVTDSACDLPPAVADKLGIDIVPLTVRFGSEELVDRRDVTPTDFWERCAQSPILPETAAPPPGAFQEAFSNAASTGHGAVVCVTLSQDLSATFQSAHAAANACADVIPVRVLDSRSVTMGEGLAVIQAAEAAAAGVSIDEVSAACLDVLPRLRAFGALGNLDALKKGGRIGGARALVGSLLAIKPIIEVRDGAVHAESKQRTRTRSLEYLVDKVRQNQPVERLAVMHGGAADIDTFLDMLGEVFPLQDMLVADIGPVIGTHTGPGTVGVVFVLPAA